MTRWRKLGKIFDPAEHRLPNNCVEFAQSPQTIVFDDFVRVYFSTRERDRTGKYLSHVAYADFTRDFSALKGVSTKTVIPLGELGCFDEHGIFPINVLKDGNRILAYTTGWSRRVSVSADGSIGLAVSTDGGLTFQRHGRGPVLTASLHEPFLVGDGFVGKFQGLYHMWYIHGTDWKEFVAGEEPDRVYKIAHATSSDGESWTKEGRRIISDRLGADECQALPSVAAIGGVYHMTFCYRHASGFRRDKERAYRLGFASSTDLINWTRNDEWGGLARSDAGWDSDMMCYPHLFTCDEKVYLLYNGNEFGRAGFGLAVLEQS